MRGVPTFALALAVAAGGCTTGSWYSKDDVHYRKSEGLAEVYAAPVDALWPAAVRVFRDFGAKVTDENRLKGYMIAECQNNGGYAAVWFEPAESSTLVTAVTMRKGSLNIKRTFSEREFHWMLRTRSGVCEPAAAPQEPARP